jgi:hypothetical protein
MFGRVFSCAVAAFRLDMGFTRNVWNLMHQFYYKMPLPQFDDNKYVNFNAA